MRIISGKYRGKKIFIPKDSFTRPLRDLVKESIFNILNHSNLLNSKLNESFVLDLFSGVGSFGLEAISRGMSEVIFFENNIEVLKILKKNCLSICKSNQFKIYEEDLIHSKLEIEFQNISVVYIDPPYAKYNLTNLLENLSSNIKNTTVIGLETGVKDNILIPENLNLLQKKTYGKTIIYIFKLS